MVWAMATLLIRKIDDDVKTRLRVRAAKAGRSMEEEARVILTRETQNETRKGMSGAEVLALMESLFADEHEELELPPRDRDRPPVDFSE